MTTTEELTQLWNDCMMPNYGTPPIALASGEGVRVTDVDGQQYLDFIAGIATSSLGHNHPAIVGAVSAQVATIAHTSNLVMQEPALRLAQRLVELAGGGARVFFSNDGATANEAAIKLVRKHAAKLRKIALLLASILPALILLLPLGLWGIALAAAIHLAGALAARWLFFAEAEHVVGLYYGARG